MTDSHPMAKAQSPRAPAGIVARSVTAVQFQGPLPPPELLKGYDDILPGSANRILTMAEGEQTHRHGMEERSMKYGASIAVIGQLFGFLLALTILGGAMYLLATGKNIAGFGTLIPAICGLVALFMVGKKNSESAQPSK